MKGPSWQRRLAVVLILVLFAFQSMNLWAWVDAARLGREGSGLWDKAALATASPTPTVTAGDPNSTRGPFSPVPYGEAEFPQELKDLRRGEVITLGAVPITYLVSSIFYDVGRYVYKVATGESDASTYAPLFFAPSDKPSNTTEETIGLLVSSLVLGLGIAIADNIVVNEERKARIQEEKRIQLLREARENLLLATPSPSPAIQAEGLSAPGAVAPIVSPSPQASPSPAPSLVPSATPLPSGQI